MARIEQIALFLPQAHGIKYAAGALPSQNMDKTPACEAL